MNGVITYEREFSPFSVAKYFKVWREYEREDGYRSNPKGKNIIVLKKEITKEHYEYPITTEVELCRERYGF